jgi:excisionase family DNA binding protein
MSPLLPTCPALPTLSTRRGEGDGVEPPAAPAAAADDLVTYPRAAARIGTTPGTLRALVSRGRIPHYRFGPRMVRFSLRDLDAWIESNRRMPTAPGGAK